MASGGGGPAPVSSAERRAAVARARSAHETNCAEQHELLADEAPSQILRDPHTRIAAAHRSTAARHRTAARLQDDYAARLTGRVGEQGAPRPLFMAGVTAACGTGSAALTLVSATLDQLALAVFAPAPGIVGSAVLTEVAEALTHSMILDVDADPGLYGATDLRPVVHQAAGVVCVQSHCQVADALELIKARAFTEGTCAHSVATRIVRGELRLG